MSKVIYKIPIGIDKYEDLFNELDYRELENRFINEDIDDLINKHILSNSIKSNEYEIEIIIHIPNENRNEEIEIKVREGIENYYNTYYQNEVRIGILGLRRIIYYITMALILLSSWYFIDKYKGQSFFTALMSAGGTVLLWEIMSLVLIERKNYKLRIDVKKKFLNMSIVFMDY